MLLSIQLQINAMNLPSAGVQIQFGPRGLEVASTYMVLHWLQTVRCVPDRTRCDCSDGCNFPVRVMYNGDLVKRDSQREAQALANLAEIVKTVRRTARAPQEHDCYRIFHHPGLSATRLTCSPLTDLNWH